MNQNLNGFVGNMNGYVNPIMNQNLLNSNFNPNMMNCYMNGYMNGHMNPNMMAGNSPYMNQGGAMPDINNMPNYMNKGAAIAGQPYSSRNLRE